MPRKGDYKPKLNLIGQKFGRLTVLEYAGWSDNDILKKPVDTRKDWKHK